MTAVSVKQNTQIDYQVSPESASVDPGYIGLFAKSDGLYEKLSGGADLKILTSVDITSTIKDSFLATNGQTIFYTSVPYNIGNIDVFYNGIKLGENDFTANDGVSVILLKAARLNSEIDINIGNTVGSDDSLSIINAMIY